MTTAMLPAVRLTGRHCTLTLARLGLAACLLAGCGSSVRGGGVQSAPPPAPVTAPAPASPAPAPAAAPTTNTTADRLEIRLADSVAFPGSEPTPRQFEGQPVFAAAQPVVGTAEFRTVAATINDLGMPVLDLELCPTAGARLLQVTASRVGRQLMILAGEEVLSVAVITGPFGERLQLAGLQTMERTVAFARAVQARLTRTACAG